MSIPLKALKIRGINFEKIAVIFILLLLAKWWFTDPSISVPTSDVTFKYRVKYTEAGKSSDALPVLVALHGNGDTTENFFRDRFLKR